MHAWYPGKERHGLRCPECDHTAAAGKQTCLYCGSPFALETMGASDTPPREHEKSASGKGRSPSRQERERQDALEGISLQRTPARRRLGKLLLALIFVLSFAMAGFLVILMM